MKTNFAPAPAGMGASIAAEATSRATNRLTAAIANAFQALQRASSARQMRQRLAVMDDSLLLDIGIESDEIMRVRAGDSFTPRRWQQQIDGRQLSPRR